MEVKDKALLIKDLSSRLPYGVWVEHIRTGMRGHLHDLKVYPLYDKTDDHIYDYICTTDFLGDGDYFDIEAFKPLLLPLSSMTEEQKKKYNWLKHSVFVCHYEYGDVVEEIELYDSPESFEYLIDVQDGDEGCTSMGSYTYLPAWRPLPVLVRQEWY